MSDQDSKVTDVLSEVINQLIYVMEDIRRHSGVDRYAERILSLDRLRDRLRGEDQP